MATSNRATGSAAGYTLTAEPSSVSPGAPLTVSWTAARGAVFRGLGCLFRAGDPDGDHLWWSYTGGTTSGSIPLTAPGSSGEYEFGYFLQKGNELVATSNRVTVDGGGGLS
ncbi:MAG: hypothetical protein M3463_07275 [Verrucomicrobiota bacterium]|nr:hypothetical protein [Verrucomicrobiota bacterium]